MTVSPPSPSRLGADATADELSARQTPIGPAQSAVVDALLNLSASSEQLFEFLKMGVEPLVWEGRAFRPRANRGNSHAYSTSETKAWFGLRFLLRLQASDSLKDMVIEVGMSHKPACSLDSFGINPCAEMRLGPDWEISARDNQDDPAQFHDAYDLFRAAAAAVASQLWSVEASYQELSLEAFIQASAKRLDTPSTDTLTALRELFLPELEELALRARVEPVPAARVKRSPSI